MLLCSTISPLLRWLARAGVELKWLLAYEIKENNNSTGKLLSLRGTGLKFMRKSRWSLNQNGSVTMSYLAFHCGYNRRELTFICTSLLDLHGKSLQVQPGRWLCFSQAKPCVLSFCRLNEVVLGPVLERRFCNVVSVCWTWAWNSGVT